DKRESAICPLPDGASFSLETVFDMGKLFGGLLLLIFGLNFLQAAISHSKRQTFVYDESLKQYARPHPRTRIITGTVGRYAPQEWPSWYTRTIFKWNGETRMAPYHPNDSRYGAYNRVRFQSQ
uniref:Uncharacterized protein n=1 Tax=Parascaris univalens TaxID=6257 RepID=A0A915BFN4_PARUN